MHENYNKCIIKHLRLFYKTILNSNVKHLRFVFIKQIDQKATPYTINHQILANYQILILATYNESIPFQEVMKKNDVDLEDLRAVKLLNIGHSSVSYQVPREQFHL